MKAIGTGFNVFKVGKVEGRVRKVERPRDVVELLAKSKEQMKEFILITPSGTATFVAPILIAGIKGIVALTGAPESHLGILVREFRIPTIMGFNLEGINLEDIKENATILLDCEDERVGRAYLK